MQTVMDIFNDDAFSFVSLTDQVNRLPFEPGQAGLAVNWNTTGVATTTIAIELRSRQLSMLQPLPRGGPGQSFKKQTDKMISIPIPHYQVDDAISADEVQGRRAFGADGPTVETIEGYLEERRQEHVSLRLNPTMEFMRMGALQGIIVNWDGSVLLNLYTAFGIAQPSAVNFPFSVSPGDGTVRTAGAALKRKITKAFGGTASFSGITALCSPEFFDALISSDEVRKTFLNQQEASELRADYAYGGFDFGGIHWEEYRGSAPQFTDGVTDTQFLAANTAIAFPTGVVGLNIYRTVFAPADYNETVNTMGLPRYEKIYDFENDKGKHYELQTNPLAFCTYPDVLIPLTKT